MTKIAETVTELPPVDIKRGCVFTRKNKPGLWLVHSCGPEVHPNGERAAGFIAITFRYPEPYKACEEGWDLEAVLFEEVEAVLAPARVVGMVKTEPEEFEK